MACKAGSAGLRVRVLCAPKFYYTPATLSLHLNRPPRPRTGARESVCACVLRCGSVRVHGCERAEHASAGGAPARTACVWHVRRGCLPCASVDACASALALRACACLCAFVPALLASRTLGSFWLDWPWLGVPSSVAQSSGCAFVLRSSYE